MSLKSLFQIIIILIIITILGGVYFNYFANNSTILQENNEKNIQSEIDKNKDIKNEKKNLDIEVDKKKYTKNEKKALDQVSNKEADIVVIKQEQNKEEKKLESETTDIEKNIKPDKPKIDNVVKDIEYLTTDKSGNKYKILATSGRTNSENKNILDLDNVRGVISSKDKSTVYIVSDFAEYNSSNLQSNFYQNVIINYEDKEITCDYFDVDMQTNIAIAYNNVVVRDPQSIMKAGKIILNIETKVININPDNKKEKVTVKIN